MATLSAFDPPAHERTDLLARAGALVEELMTDGATREVMRADRGDELAVRLVGTRPGARPREVAGVLDELREVLATGVDNAAGGELAYIPGSGLLSSAVGDLLASVANRYTGLAGLSPAAVALEQSVLHWMTETFGLPESAQGILLSGGSAANLSALVAAREKHAGGRSDLATVYVGEHAHASVRKAARIAGIPGPQVRVCGSLDGARIDPEAVRIGIKQDLADGLTPIAVVGAAGTTNAGAVDPLRALAAVAREAGIWFHVDAAYGGFFQLTARGKARLAGIDQADSITLDPHKSLFLPFGTGALLVRDRADLARAFNEDADYLRDHGDPAIEDPEALPDFGSLTPELTRAWRGLRVWLPLHLHGVDAFRDALDLVLDLAAEATIDLHHDPHLELVGSADLSIVTFRLRGGDDAVQDLLLAAVNADGRVHLSSTVVDGRVVLRLAILSHRTTRATVALALELLGTEARRVVGAGAVTTGPVAT